MSSDTADLDCCLSYALQQLGSPEMRLKPEQQSAIECVYRGKDVFVSLPTGFGKCICYQMLPFVFDSKLDWVDSESGKCVAGSIVLVISPLISLMIDQVIGLVEQGVKAAIITTRGGVKEELRATENDMGNYSLLCCTPEALTASRWREALERPPLSQRLVAVVVDEAHCVQIVSALLHHRAYQWWHW